MKKLYKVYGAMLIMEQQKGTKPFLSDQITSLASIIEVSITEDYLIC